MTTRRNSGGGALAAVAVTGALVLTGCQSPASDEAAADGARETQTVTTAEATTPSSPDPEAYGPLPRPDLASEGDAAPAGEPGARAPESSEADADAVVPETGRPAWWFAEARQAEGKLTVCAEVLGATMLEVRRAVLDAARERMRRELGLAPGAPIRGEVVERVWTTPLPTSRSGDVRYAGYAMMSAERP